MTDWNKTKARGAAALCTILLCATAGAWAQDAEGDARDDSTDSAQIEARAKGMLQRGIELVESGQAERGVKLVSSVPQMYPKAKARFAAWLYLGKQYIKNAEYSLAIKSLRQVEDSDNDEEQAESLYQIGICYFQMDRYNNAFIAFRKVTNEYPWSVQANEAYYYIGQCHYQLGRWTKAIEALEMVGTSVEPGKKGGTKAESGQRLYVKVFDKDFVVLASRGEAVGIVATAGSGDSEKLTLEPLGRSGEYFIGSVRTALGTPVSDNNVLEVRGQDAIQVRYVDENTRSGKVDQPLLATVKMVSTASIGFTDGAYREYIKGVYGDKDCFLRVKDDDRDTSDARDRLRVHLRTEYKIRRDEGEMLEDTDLDTQAERIVLRDEMDFELVETEPHSGIFVGSLVPRIVHDQSEINQTDAVLGALQGDELVMSYVDEQYMAGEDPRTLEAKAKLLVGQIQDVRVEHRVVESLRDKARKNLIEGKIFLKLAQIFKDVGLKGKAAEKADEGLARIDEVISVSLKGSLDRSTVEEAFSVKWDLLLAKDELGQAIAVCRTLMRLFPDSSLADEALFKIAVAKKDAGEIPDALRIFTEVTQLKNTDLAPEAQLNIAQISEERAATAEGRQKTYILSQAMLAYKKVSDSWPDSPQAGKALEWVAQYYIDSKDYARAIELMERVFQDYEDADFLPVMLAKWALASYRMGDMAQAKAKCEQCISQYPNSPAAAWCKKVLPTIERAAGGGE